MKEIPPHIKEKIDKLTGELKAVYKLAEESWEGCDGCDENDKNFFINGFVKGYLHLKLDVQESVQKSVQGYWYGRGILAAKTDRISELAPKSFVSDNNVTHSNNLQ
jgi:hypothetical protein